MFENQIKERITSIIFSKFDSYKEWENEGRPNLMGIPLEYGIIKKPVFTKGGVPDIRKDVTKEELERIRKELDNYLWGGGRYVGNEIFNFIMKLFLAKYMMKRRLETIKPISSKFSMKIVRLKRQKRRQNE